jgi:CxxC-x17-CxxC domain-containing protein
MSFSTYRDQTITCRDCGVTFTFTAGEQEFFASRGFDNAPSRCPECRAARKAQRTSGGYDAGRGYSSYGNGGRSGYGGGRRELHAAVCASCGQEAMVPFVPRGDKPVYCSSCFDRVRGR